MATPSARRGSSSPTTASSAARRGWPSCAWTRWAARARSRCGASSRSRGSRCGRRSTRSCTRRRGRARVRHPGRPREQELVRERRGRSRHRPAHRSDPRHGDQPHVRPAGLRRQAEAGRAPAADRPQGGRGGQLPGPQPRDIRLLSAGLDLQAGHGARSDARAARRALRAALLHGEDGDRRHHVPELEPVRERGDGPADRARGLVRHLLLPTGPRVLRPPAGVRQPAPEVGLGLRIREGDRAGRRR